MRALTASLQPSEFQIQAAVFEWAYIMTPLHPELLLLYAIPNSAKRRPGDAGRMKAAGLKAGVPDCHLPVARKGFIGLWIEHKAGKNDLTEKQADWMTRLRLAGHLCVLSRSFEHSRDTIVGYLT